MALRTIRSVAKRSTFRRRNGAHHAQSVQNRAAKNNRVTGKAAKSS